MYRYPSYNLSTTDLREFPGGTLFNGDCLDVIKTLPAASVDCIITDPPYFLGMTHNGQKGNFRDLSICRPFYRDLFHEYRRVAKPEACIYFFCDWRGYAFYYPLFDEILKAHNMLVWDKLSGPGNHYAFITRTCVVPCRKGREYRRNKHNFRHKEFHLRGKEYRRREGSPHAKAGSPDSKVYRGRDRAGRGDSRHFRRFRLYRRGCCPLRPSLYPHGARRRILPHCL